LVSLDVKEVPEAGPCTERVGEEEGKRERGKEGGEREGSENPVRKVTEIG
jgi:hypothetical protein